MIYCTHNNVWVNVSSDQALNAMPYYANNSAKWPLPTMYALMSLQIALANE
jgi:hypothetical protein